MTLKELEAMMHKPLTPAQEAKLALELKRELWRLLTDAHIELLEAKLVRELEAAAAAKEKSNG